jgi:hypothetical protein
VAGEDVDGLVEGYPAGKGLAVLPIDLVDAEIPQMK